MKKLKRLFRSRTRERRVGEVVSRNEIEQDEKEGIEELEEELKPKPRKKPAAKAAKAKQPA